MADPYYEQLVGCKIVAYTESIDDEGVWPTFTLEYPDHTTFKVEVSRDPEGNGPGFLFIGPQEGVPS